MNCPHCRKADSAVIDSRAYPGSEVMRRRKCLGCGARWTSDERPRRGSLVIGEPQPAVVKSLDLATTGSGQSDVVDLNRSRSIGGEGGALTLYLPPDSGSGSALRASQQSGSDARVERRRKVAYPKEFLLFWAKYPNKKKKLAAAIAWAKEQPDLGTVLAALEWQIRTPEWLKDGGAYIPHASTYINGRRWEDERPAVKPIPRREVY